MSSTSSTVRTVARTQPSETAKQACGDDVVNGLDLTFDMTTVRPIRRTWRNGVYSCDLAYAHGATATVSDTELSTEVNARAYYARVASRLGRTRSVLVGEESFATANGSFVTRWRNNVLVVDASRLPADFATRNGRADYTQTVAVAVLAEWDPM